MQFPCGAGVGNLEQWEQEEAVQEMKATLLARACRGGHLPGGTRRLRAKTPDGGPGPVGAAEITQVEPALTQGRFNLAAMTR